MSEEQQIMRRVLRISPAGVQRVGDADHVHFHHLAADVEVAQGHPCEVEMCCHACGKAAIVRFSMSTITVRPTPLRQREIDQIRDEFVRTHRECTRDERVDYATMCPCERDGDHVFYDLSVGVS